MESFASPFIQLLAGLDRLRVIFLRVSLGQPVLRSIFMDRAQRTLFFYMAAVLLYLPLSFFLPMWVLAIGPVLWGVPHILASLRYIGRPQTGQDNTKFIFNILFVIWIAISALHFVYERQFFNFGFLESWHIDLFAAAVAVVSLGWLLRHRVSLLGLAAVAAVAICSWLQPAWTGGALVILHNWMAFAYWYLAVRDHGNKHDLRTFKISFAIFILVHAFVFAGCADFFFHSIAPGTELGWAGLDFMSIGQSIAPYTADVTLFYHLVVLYAFGQSLHYLIWLKIIPEMHLPSQNPSSFRLSAIFLLQDMGKHTAVIGIGLCAVGVGAWFTLQYPEARALYFAVAACHGYLEIAGLSFQRKIAVA